MSSPLPRLARRDRRVRSTFKKLVLEHLECRNLLTADVWTGGAGDNLWNSPGNWSLTAVPNSSNDVEINIPANITYSGTTASTINSLTSTEPLTITGGSLTIATASTTTSTITIDGGTLTANGSLSVGGTLTLQKGTLSGSGTVDATGGMSIATPFANTFVLDGITLDNALGQTATFAAGWTVTAQNGAVFNNYGSSVVQGGTYSQGTGATAAFDNEGSFDVSQNGGALVTFLGVPFNTQGGSVDVENDGVLSLLSGGTTTGGTLTAEAGSELELGGVQTFDAASTINGAGTVEITSGQNANLSQFAGVTTVNGTYDVSGTTTVTNSGYTGQLNLDGTVQSIGSTLNVTLGNTLDASTAFQATAGTIGTGTLQGTENFGSNNLSFTTLLVTGGTLTFTGTITVSGVTTFGPATIGAGVIDADGGITVQSNNYNLIFAGTTLNNGVGESVTLSYGLTLEDGALFNNYGTLSLGDNVVMVPGTGTLPLFTNYGTLIGAAGSGHLAQIYVALTNIGGTVEALTGALQLNGPDQGGSGPNQALNSTGGTITAESGAELDIGGNGTLDAATTVNGAGIVAFLDDTASFFPTSTVTVYGPYDVTGTTDVGTGFYITSNTNTLILDGPVTSLGSILNVSGEGALFITPSFPVGGGLTGAASIDGTLGIGTNTWNPTSLTVGVAVIDTNGTINVSGLLTFAANGELSGSGIINANGGIGNVGGGSGPILNGVTFNLPVGQSGLFSGAIGFDGGAVFNDYGSVTAVGGTGVYGGTGVFNDYGSFTPQGTSIFYGATFNVNGGTVNIGDNTLAIQSGGSSVDGTFTTTAGGQLFIGYPSVATPFTIDANTTFSGGGGFYKDGTSTLILPGTSTLTGPTILYEGGFQVDGSQSGSTITFQNSATTLSGTGTVGPIVAPTGTVSPGDSPTVTGVLTADGDVTIGSNFDVALNGKTLGTEYDQLNATGTITLTGSSLNATLGYTPSAGDALTIIKSTSPIVGTFTQGSSITVGAVTFAITYTDDSVILTAQNAPATTATSTTLSSSLNPANPGQPVTFTAIVAAVPDPGTPTGTVTFSIDGVAQTPVLLTVVGDNDEASLPADSSLTSGDHSITAVYSGDSSFSSSTATPLSQVINPASLTATTTTLLSSANPSTFGQPVTFTAVVAPAPDPGTPTGTVTFSINGVVQPPVALQLVNGRDEASLPPVTGLTVGSYIITATYNGDSSFTASTAAPLTQTVGKASTTITVTSAPNPAYPGQPVTFTAIVTPVSAPGTPTGTVTFLIDGQAQPPVPLVVVDGKDEAVLPPINNLPVGSHVVTATYNGDASFAFSYGYFSTQVIPAAVAPTVVNLQRFGYHLQPTALVLTFSFPLAVGPAENVSNYQITFVGGHAPSGVKRGGTVAVVQAIYNPATLTVTLLTSKRLNIHDVYRITVNGMAPNGLTGATGVLLAGAGNVAGTNFIAPITRKTLVGRFSQAFPPVAPTVKVTPKAHPKEVKLVRH